MGKQGRPEAGIEEYREWERRLERYDVSETSLDVFCLQEGVSRSTFYRWKQRLENGIPDSLKSDSAGSDGDNASQSLFLPVGASCLTIAVAIASLGVGVAVSLIAPIEGRMKKVTARNLRYESCGPMANV